MNFEFRTKTHRRNLKSIAGQNNDIWRLVKSVVPTCPDFCPDLGGFCPDLSRPVPTCPDLGGGGFWTNGTSKVQAQIKNYRRDLNVLFCVIRIDLKHVFFVVFIIKQCKMYDFIRFVSFFIRCVVLKAFP